MLSPAIPKTCNFNPYWKTLPSTSSPVSALEYPWMYPPHLKNVLCDFYVNPVALNIDSAYFCSYH